MTDKEIAKDIVVAMIVSNSFNAVSTDDERIKAICKAYKKILASIAEENPSVVVIDDISKK